ncbi:MAG TPA: hypothetical protein PLI79_05635 [Mycobacterium sp.]|nr:hypothetical protein [Mycobacterium sp.]
MVELALGVVSRFVMIAVVAIATANSPTTAAAISPPRRDDPPPPVAEAGRGNDVTADDPTGAAALKALCC